MQSRFFFALFILSASLLALPLSSTLAIAEDNNGAFVDGAGFTLYGTCLLYTSDAADERSSVDLGGRRIIQKKKKK